MSYISDFKSALIGLFQTSTDNSAQVEVGQRFYSSDGREFVLVKNGTVALVAGNLIQHSPIVANHQNLAVTAFSAASASTGALATVTVTLGATQAAPNLYQGGLAVVNAGTGIGQTLRISSHPATAASGSMAVTLEDNPVVALDTTSKICLIAQPYSGVVINPTTATASPAGVSLYAIPASTTTTQVIGGVTYTVPSTNYYGFIQTKGVVSCLSDVSVASVGLRVSSSTTTAGAITVGAATLNSVGVAYQTGISAESRAIFVNL